jgi:lipid-A-disaccharide synthase
LTALKIFIVAGEHSGDALGAKLMAALKSKLGPGTIFSGVGGAEMAQQGLQSIFPIEDVAVMGPLAILPALPRITRRVYQAVAAALAMQPDVVIIIDSPEFTHPLAKRIRKRAPAIPIIDYVCPSVWAWRPGRARKMRPYVDEVLCLLPFEPGALSRLSGPRGTYVGHPLIERLPAIEGADAKALAQRLKLDAVQPVLLVLPGSRRSEVERLIGVFGETVGRLASNSPAFEIVIPALPHVRAEIEAASAVWAVKPHIVDSATDKYAAMRLARAALAASGTVTLELALAGTPMVVAYKVDKLIASIRFLIKTPSVILANLILGENAFPEFLQEAATADALSAALQPLMSDTPARARQVDALARIPEKMKLPSGAHPSDAAADVVLRVLEM